MKKKHFMQALCPLLISVSSIIINEGSKGVPLQDKCAIPQELSTNRFYRTAKPLAPGTEIEVTLPAEKALGIDGISGKYLVGSKGEITLKDGLTLQPDSRNTNTEDILRRYIAKRYSEEFPLISYPSPAFLKPSILIGGHASQPGLRLISGGSTSLDRVLLETKPLLYDTNTSCVFIQDSSGTRVVDISSHANDNLTLPYIPIENGSLLYFTEYKSDTYGTSVSNPLQSNIVGNVQILFAGDYAKVDAMKNVKSGTTVNEFLTENVNHANWRWKNDQVKVYSKIKGLNIGAPLIMRYNSQEAKKAYLKEGDTIILSLSNSKKSLLTLQDLLKSVSGAFSLLTPLFLIR